MNITSSYTCRIQQKSDAPFFENTVAIYTDAVRYLVAVVHENWEDLKDLNAKKRVNLVERLTHATKENPNPRYSFDSRFYKFPSYFRRAAISTAIGKISSWMSNCANWEKNPKGKKPGFPSVRNEFPAFYKENMFKDNEDGTAEIKVYKNNDWVWIPITFRKCDLDYIRHHCMYASVSNPTLMQKGRNWMLQFAFTESVELTDVPLADQTIVAVDLGINEAAVCSVMKADGTVIGRRTLHLPAEKDRMNHQLNKIKKAQQHGNRRTHRLWRFAKNTNTIITRKTAEFILQVALEYEADVIVFEHLDLNKKKRGSRKQRLALWKARDVQKIVTHHAHLHDIRVSRICAWGTSKYAFDGSGPVERGFDESHNYSICRFPSGKVYNCDLSASYNIGARYFIREYSKIIESRPETARLDIQAKVPEYSKRSTCTYSSLINLLAALKPYMGSNG